MSRKHAALSGAAATLLWAALEPIDKRIFRNDYSDVAVLGKFVTRTRAWPVVGVALHAANGALFGLAFAEVQRRTSAPTRRLALSLALAENFALFPLSYLVDRAHPARGEPGVVSLFSARAFAQATVRHTIFGGVLGLLEARHVEQRGAGRRGSRLRRAAALPQTRRPVRCRSAPLPAA